MEHHTSSPNPRESYQLAWKQLYERYGQPHIIASSCERRLQETPKLGRNDPDGLEKLAVLLKRCCVSLAEISGTSTVDSVSFIASIANKLPVEMQSKWVSTSVALPNDSGRVARFADFANFVIKQSERANSVFGRVLSPPSSEKSQNRTATKQKATSYNSVTSAVAQKPPSGERQSPKQGRACPCCSERHSLENCLDFERKSCRERRQLARSKGMCYRCLKGGHMVADCSSKTACSHEGCGSVYHYVLLHHPSSDTVEATNLTCKRPSGRQ